MSSSLLNPVATVLAALVGSAPGWVAVRVTQRRDLNKQTNEIRTVTEQQTEAIRRATAEVADAQTDELKRHLERRGAHAARPLPSDEVAQTRPLPVVRDREQW